MATLDVLDYVVRLDEALAQRLAPAERKMATREVRHLVDDLAFRFAALDGRVVPEDLDYARALEALHEPRRAAAAIERLGPRLTRRRRRRLATTAVILLALGIAVAALANFVASERADPLVDRWFVIHESPGSESAERAFDVPDGTTRLQVTAPVVVYSDASGARVNTITLTVVDPAGQVRFTQEFTARSSFYAKRTIEAPAPGAWTAYVDFRDAAGRVELTILGVSPRA